MKDYLLLLLLLIVAIFGPAINVVLGKFVSSNVLGHLAFIHKVAGILGILAALYLLVFNSKKIWLLFLELFLCSIKL